MRHVRMLGVCLVALFALGAVMVSAASAKSTLPEWGRCEPTAESTGGVYADAACTVKAKKHKGVLQGGYEWEPLASRNSNELIEAPGGVTFETAAGKVIECTAMSTGLYSHMVLEGPSITRKTLWEFTGCHSEGTGAGHECNNYGGVGNVINTDTSFPEEQYENEEGEPLPFSHGLKGQLGYIEGKGGPNPVVGLAITPNNYKSQAFEEEVGGVGSGYNTERFIDPPIICQSAIGTVWIGGDPVGGNSVIAKITPVDQMTNEFTQTYSESGPGVQSPQSFHGGKLKTLQASIKGHWEPVAMTATMTWEVTPEEKVVPGLEIKATK